MLIGSIRASESDGSQTLAPQLVGQTGRAKSYAERLFEFAPIDRLDADAARAAPTIPAQREGVSYNTKAVTEILLRRDKQDENSAAIWMRECRRMSNGGRA